MVDRATGSFVSSPRRTNAATVKIVAIRQFTDDRGAVEFVDIQRDIATDSSADPLTVDSGKLSVSNPHSQTALPRGSVQRASFRYPRRSVRHAGSLPRRG